MRTTGSMLGERKILETLAEELEEEEEEEETVGTGSEVTGKQSNAFKVLTVSTSVGIIVIESPLLILLK